MKLLITLTLVVGHFVFAVEYTPLKQPAALVDDTVSIADLTQPQPQTAIPLRAVGQGWIVRAHYGLAGTAFHSFRAGESVWLDGPDGGTHKFILVKSWTAPLWATYEFGRYDILFITCLNDQIKDVLIWGGIETE